MRFIVYATATGAYAYGAETFADPATLDPLPAGFSRHFEAPLGDLTEAEYQLATSGERTSFNPAGAVGSRVSENPYPRIRFTPDTFDLDVGEAPGAGNNNLQVQVRAEQRDGTLIPFNGTYLLYKEVNGQKLATRVTLANGVASLPIDTSAPRFVRIGDQDNAAGNLRAIAVKELRITVADNDI